MDHLEYLVSFICMKTDRVDSMAKGRKAEELDEEEQTDTLSTVTTASRGPSAHTYLGAPEKDNKPLSELTRSSIPNPLHILGVFTNKSHTGEEGYYKVQKDNMVDLFAPLKYVEANMCTLQIREFHYLRVTYRSMVNWQDDTNLLCCNESFHHQPQYDHVLVASEDGGPPFALCAFSNFTQTLNSTI